MARLVERAQRLVEERLGGERNQVSAWSRTGFLAPLAAVAASAAAAVLRRRLDRNLAEAGRTLRPRRRRE